MRRPCGKVWRLLVYPFLPETGVVLNIEKIEKCSSEMINPTYCVAASYHSIRYFGPFLWSKLSKELRNISTLNVFKSEIRKVEY